MEFPNLGEHCSRPSCKTLDFLPFPCSYCNRIFCKEHFNQDSHGCEFIGKNADNRVLTKSIYCSDKGCTNSSPVEMLCPKCSRHFCLEHRYHDCFDTVADIEEKKRMWNKPKEQFAESLKSVQKTVDENIKRAMNNPKKQATAMKVQLMKLKGKAAGTSTIPTADRIYFLLALPKSTKKESKAIFVSKDWSVGKVIDSACTICNVTNRNNEANSQKLRLFKTDGIQISSDMSSKMSDLMEKNVIINGETLIMEYVNQNEDLINFVLSDCSQYNNLV